MRYALITALVCFVLVTGRAHAATPDQWIPQPFAGTIYLDKSKCPGECYSIVKDGKLVGSPDVLQLVTVQVDDRSKPLYSAKAKQQPCADKKACQDLIKDGLFCQGLDGYQATIAQDYSEAYCVKLLGYEKRLEKQLVVDTALAAAKEQAKIDALSEASLKAQKKVNREAPLKKCLKDLKANPVAQGDVEKCLLLVLKEMISERVKASDL